MTLRGQRVIVVVAGIRVPVEVITHIQGDRWLVQGDGLPVWCRRRSGSRRLVVDIDEAGVPRDFDGPTPHLPQRRQEYSTLRPDILTLVARGPHSTKRIAALLGLPRQVIRAECRELCIAGQVEQLRDSTWTLPRPESPGRPRASLPPHIAGRMCARCHQRYRQSADGLCRRCSHEAGVPAPPRFAQDAERVERQRATDASVVRVPDNDLIRDGGIRTIVIGGIEYDALSVGSAPVTGDYKTGSALNQLHRIAE